jgi:hypothetical protein
VLRTVPRRRPSPVGGTPSMQTAGFRFRHSPGCRAAIDRSRRCPAAASAARARSAPARLSGSTSRAKTAHKNCDSSFQGYYSYILLSLLDCEPRLAINQRKCEHQVARVGSLTPPASGSCSNGYIELIEGCQLRAVIGNEDNEHTKTAPTHAMPNLLHSGAPTSSS